jgi:hypothetical protein
LLAGGIVFFMQTPDGVVRIQIDDPDVKVSVEGEKAVITQKNAKPITITPGKRGLTIERDGFDFETTEFTLKRRQDTILTVQWLKGNEVVVRQDEREIHRSFANTGGGEPGDKGVEFKDDLYLGVYDDWPAAYSGMTAFIRRSSRFESF